MKGFYEKYNLEITSFVCGANFVFFARYTLMNSSPVMAIVHFSIMVLGFLTIVSLKQEREFQVQSYIEKSLLKLAKNINKKSHESNNKS